MNPDDNIVIIFEDDILLTELFTKIAKVVGHYIP